MTVDDVLAAVPHRVVRAGRSAAPAAGGLTTGATIRRFPAGRSTCSVAFLFDAAHRLRGIEMRSVDANDAVAFDELAAWVSSRHGAPSGADEGSPRGRSRRASWVTSTSVIELESTPGQPDPARGTAVDGGAGAVRPGEASGARLLYTPRAPEPRSPQ